MKTLEQTTQENFQGDCSPAIAECIGVYACSFAGKNLPDGITVEDIGGKIFRYSCTSSSETSDPISDIVSQKIETIVAIIDRAIEEIQSEKVTSLAS